MRIVPLAACLIAALIQPGAAIGLSITNRDDHDHKVTIVEGTRSTDHVLKPDATLDNVCLKGCVVRLNDSDEDEYELEGDEVVSIEDSYLYYDNPDAPTSPPAEDGKAGEGKGTGKK
jgi:hypothetical protein